MAFAIIDAVFPAEKTTHKSLDVRKPFGGAERVSNPNFFALARRAGLEIKPGARLKISIEVEDVV